MEMEENVQRPTPNVQRPTEEAAGSGLRDAQGPMGLSVQPEWCRTLSIQQQSVLFLGARGPDGIAKSHPCKRIQRAYRGTVLVAARYGRCLKWGERADTFMSLDEFAGDATWEAILSDFFQHADDLPHHFYMHLIHGAEIIGYKHPDPRFRERWSEFYEVCVKDFHLTVETEREMDARLSDWQRIYWTRDLSGPAPKFDSANGASCRGCSRTDVNNEGFCSECAQELLDNAKAASPPSSSSANARKPMTFRSPVTCEFDVTLGFRWRMILASLNPFKTRMQFEFTDSEIVLNASLIKEQPAAESLEETQSHTMTSEAATGRGL